MDFENRMKKVRARLDDLSVDGLLVTNLTNVRYLTGFSGSNGQVLVTGSEAFFYSDGRYAQRAKSLVHGADIGIYPDRLTDLLAPKAAADGITRLGIEAMSMTLHESQDLGSRLSGVELIPTSSVVEDFRRTKEPAEIELIDQAVTIAEGTLEWMLGRLSVGQSEREVALDLEVHMRQAGAEDVSFEPIVGSGPLSAHIHHTPSERLIAKGDLVLMDFGALVEGYHSDMTRTVVIGAASDEQQEMYEVVLRAQAAGIEALAATVEGSAVDAAARKVVADTRWGGFDHGLGHGVGLDIHEEPRLSKLSEHTLRAGEVVTVEPGLYVPDIGGVRIEDCVVVTEDGAEVLGRAPKNDLMEL